MSEPDYASDIPESAAIGAHSGTSQVPERRGQQEREGYAATMRADHARLLELADTDEKRAALESEWSRYRAGYRQRTLRQLASQARIVSMWIAGPSNFPVRRMEKRNEVERRRRNELIEFRERALKAIRRVLQPELAPIMSGDADAKQRLVVKIGEAEARQERMLAVNKAHKRFLKDPDTLETAPVSEQDKASIRRYVPAYSWEPHPFAPFELTNNGANIRRMKCRLVTVAQTQAMPTVESDGANGIRLEDAPSENRIRLFFPGKPDADTRAALKSRGFRWTPSLGCWQAYRNHASLTHAQTLAGGPA